MRLQTRPQASSSCSAVGAAAAKRNRAGAKAGDPGGHDQQPAQREDEPSDEVIRAPGRAARWDGSGDQLAASVVAAVGRALHGCPGLDTLALIELAVVLAFAAWALRTVLAGRPSYFTYLVIAIVGLWEGLDLLPVLLHHYVLIALPAFVARTATVLCVGASAGILVLVFGLAELASPRQARPGAGSVSSKSRPSGVR